MSEMFDNTNRGVMFKNQKKDSERHPDYTGKVNVDGKDYDLSCWIKQSKSGQKFFSLSVKEPWVKPVGADAKAAKQSDFINDDVPF